MVRWRGKVTAWTRIPPLLQNPAEGEAHSCFAYSTGYAMDQELHADARLINCNCIDKWPRNRARATLYYRLPRHVQVVIIVVIICSNPLL